MNKKFANILPLIITTIFGAGIIVFFYGKVLMHPNDYIFSNSGDGLKNYYTYAYHIQYDSTYTNLEGMNYPYGENYLYTDSHPILSNTFKWLSSTMPFFATHAIGILNILMIASILFTFIIVYLLLVNFKLNKWMSVFFSISITLLAPQLFRLSGHLALSYSMAIPLSWLLALKTMQNPKTLYWPLLLLINNIFWMFIHAYLGVIAIAFVFSIWLIDLFSDKQRKEYLFKHIGLGIAVIVPIILFYFYSKITDTHIGRTNNPSGFLLSNAEFDDVLIPNAKPFFPLINKWTGGIIKLEWEARGYIGLFNSLLFIAIAITSLISIFHTKARTLLTSIFNNRLLNISLIAAYIVLLFAMGIPFKQIPVLLDILPIFKQFRATGRFVWPFYFAFTIFAAYVFQTKVLLANQRKFLGMLFLISLLGTSYAEGIQYHINTSKIITKQPNVFNKTFVTKALKESLTLINPKDYQAIIALPFYHYASESYARPRDEVAVRHSLILSYHTGIPTVCANLTRTSIKESKRIIQIVSPNYYTKKIVDDLPNKKPFLIVKTGHNFSKYEQAIIDKSICLYKNKDFELLKISCKALFSDDTHTALKVFKNKAPQLLLQNGFYISYPSKVLYYNSFETTKSDTCFRGTGSFSSVKKGKNTFAEFPPHTFETGKTYDLSIWMYNGEPDALNLWFRLIVEEFDVANNTWHTTTFLPEQAEVINGNWSLVEGSFTVRNSTNWLYIVSKGKTNSKAHLHADDLLIKEQDIDVYRVDSTTHSLFFNNHKIGLE